MNLHGGNNCRINRFENRALPTLGYYDTGNSNSNWLVSPVYPQAVASGGNGAQYTVGAATPTTGNPKTMPSSMVHGEIATVRHPTGVLHSSNQTNGYNIAAITNASPGVVTTGTPIFSISYSTATGLATANCADPTGKFFTPAISIRNTTGTDIAVSGISPSGFNKVISGANVTYLSGFVFTYPISSDPGPVTVSSGLALFPHTVQSSDLVIHFMWPKGNQFGAASSGSATLINAGPDVSQLSTGANFFGPGFLPGTTISSHTGTFNGTVLLSNPSSVSGNINFTQTGMYNLHLYPVKATVLSCYTYSIQSASGGSSNIDTTNFGPFLGAAGSQYTTLQVGSGNDRVAYPCAFADGSTPVGFFGDYVGATIPTYRTWYFDKTIAAKYDGAGNPITGTWMFDTVPNQVSIGARADFPIEAGVALINELNAMSPAHTIGMYWNAPAWGLSPMDPDYSSNSNWMVNAVDVIMNPNSTARVSGYSALGYNSSIQVNQPNLYIEYSNEFWSGTNDAPGYLANRGHIRWGVGDYPFGYQDMASLRHVDWVRAVTATSAAWLNRTKHIMGLWGGVGMSSGGDFGGNYARAFGGNVRTTPIFLGDFYTNDTTVTSGGWGTPISNLHGMAAAPYLDPASSYTDTSTGTGTFTDDSAMFSGTDNSANGGGNYTGAANSSQAITNFVNSVRNSCSPGSGALSFLYSSATNSIAPLAQFSSYMTPIGKAICNYEGGNDWAAGLNQRLGGHTLTQADNTFSIAVINSSQYGTLQSTFFDMFCALSSQCFMPSMYTWIGAGTSSNPEQRWAQSSPDAYGATSSEGGGLTAT